jgi:hypothetical protein
MARSNDEARSAIRTVLPRSGLSMRALSAAMGRDVDFVAAFLDPRRATRARPTPEDLMAASDATGIRFVELLDAIWGIPLARLADELGASRGGPLAAALARLSTAERGEVTDFALFLADGHDSGIQPSASESAGAGEVVRRRTASGPGSVRGQPSPRR